MRDPSDAIEQMMSVSWFSQAGMPGSSRTTLSVRWLGSWTEAITVRGEEETSHAFDEGLWMLTRQLSRNFSAEDRKWNDLVVDIRSRIVATICPGIDKLIDANIEIRRLPGWDSYVKGIIRGDLVRFAMEYVYSDLVPPAFYHAVFAVYQAGHFPCNWDEHWPDGTLEVF